MARTENVAHEPTGGGPPARLLAVDSTVPTSNNHKLKLPGTSFSAWILVDGAEAQTYEPTYDNDAHGAIAKCWIESKAGKEFSIHWCDNKRPHKSEGRVYVDGTRIHIGFIIPQGRKKYIQNDDHFVDSVEISARASRQLIFSELKTTDNEDESVTVDSANIGEIKIKIQYAKVARSMSQAFPSEKKELGQRLRQEQTVHETSKKAGAHKANLGAITTLDNPGSSIWYNNVGKIADVGTFIFYYRSREILMAQGTIPRPVGKRTSPEPSASNVTIVDDSDEDDAELGNLFVKISKLEKELESLRRKRKQVKQEPDTDTPKVKREKMSHNTLLAKPVCIDLTELSD